MRRIALLAGLVLLFCPPAEAHIHKLAAYAAYRPRRRVLQLDQPPVQQFTIINTAGVPAPDLFREERAIEERSYDLRAAWHTPVARFGPAGILVTILPGFAPNGTWAGYHSFCRLPDCSSLSQGPFAKVWTQNLTVQGWGITLSHEIFETLVAPYQTRPEVCDPPGLPQVWDYGVPTAGFAAPSYFTASSPYDHP